jgi:protein TonB
MKKGLVLLMLCLLPAMLFGQDKGTISTEGTVKGEQIYDIVEQYPEFPGGYSALTEWIDDNLKYPVEAAMDGIEGRVIVQFIIRPTGKIVDAKVVRGIAPSLDKEALRLINIMPNWIPGRQKGKAVNVRYTLPITFKL